MSSETHGMKNGKRMSSLVPDWAWIALAAVVVRAPSLFLPMNRDSGMFAYGGWRILHGDLPYIDFFDNKLPGVFYINAFAQTVFGSSHAGLVVFQMFYATFTAWVFHAVARRLVSRGAALTATLLFAFYHGGYALAEDGNYTESYIALPVLLAVLAILRWSRERKGYLLPALAGFLGVGAAFIKQPAALVVPAIMLFALASGRGRERWLAAGAVAVGGAVVAGSIVVWIAANGMLRDAFDANLVFNRLYFIDAYTHGFEMARWSLLRGVVLCALPIAGAMAGLASGGLRSLPVKGAAWLLVPWLALDLLGIAMGGRFYNHYFLALLPSTFMLTAVFLDRVARSRKATAAALLAGLLLFAGPVWSVESRLPEPISSALEREYHAVKWIIGKRIGRGFKLPNEQIADWISARTSASDTIYIWGWDTRIGFLAGRAFCSRYLHMHPLGATGFDRDARIRELADDIEKRSPKFIVDESALMPTTAPPLDGPGLPSTSPFFRLDGYEPVKEVVARRYRPVANVAGCVIYERRSGD